MKPEPECLRCLLTVRLKEIENINIDDEEKLAVSKEIIELITKEFTYEVELTKFATRIFNELLRRAPEIAQYYDKIKRYSNEHAFLSLKVHEKHVSALQQEHRFKYLLKLSILGNMIDYGVAEHSPRSIEITPEMVEKANIHIDDSDRLFNYVKNGGRVILWLFDNAGEAIYDLLLIKELREMGNIVVGLVKDYPGFQNDITIKDALEWKFYEVLNELHTYGCLCSTIHIDSVDKDILDLIERSNLIIAKGMSHFEYLSDLKLEKPICFLLVPKCKPVARKLGLGSTGLLVVTCKNLVNNA